MGSLVALHRHPWLHTTDFSGDVQANLMDMPFDGDHLFGEKANSALERFKESRVTAQSLDLSTILRQPYSAFHPLRGYI